VVWIGARDKRTDCEKLCFPGCSGWIKSSIKARGRGKGGRGGLLVGKAGADSALDGLAALGDARLLGGKGLDPGGPTKTKALEHRRVLLDPPLPDLFDGQQWLHIVRMCGRLFRALFLNFLLQFFFFFFSAQVDVATTTRMSSPPKPENDQDADLCDDVIVELMACLCRTSSTRVEGDAPDPCRKILAAARACIRKRDIVGFVLDGPSRAETKTAAKPPGADSEAAKDPKSKACPSGE
jgi:hypothetical protein